MNRDTRIGILGAGWVGSALGRYFATQGIAPGFYDPRKGHTDTDVLESADIIFVAVPTPNYLDGSGFDDSFLKRAIESIPVPNKIIVIKSTIVPGTTIALQEHYPEHRILHNPEFLTQSRVDEDMQFPNRQLVGYTEKSRRDAEYVLGILPRAPYEEILPATTAELIKCSTNSFYALKVAYANQLYDLCVKMGLNYDQLKDAAMAEPWMGKMHWEAEYQGYRGYGGKCLPKDTRSTIQFAKSQGIDFSLLAAAEEYNNELLKKQNIDIAWEEGSPKKSDV